jgi:hypothetical protein
LSLRVVDFFGFDFDQKYEAKAINKFLAWQINLVFLKKNCGVFGLRKLNCNSIQRAGLLFKITSKWCG